MSTTTQSLRFCDSAIRLIDHWLSIKSEGHPCPLKSNFSPMKMGNALPDIFMVEQHSHDHAELRVTGSATIDITGKDQTSANIYDICLPVHADQVKKMYRKLGSGNIAAVSRHMIVNVFGKRVATTLHLPLCDNTGDSRFIVGVMKALPITKFDQELINCNQVSPAGINIQYQDIAALT